ncbi:MAG: 4'-phosphopantetheinyl transferase superfamily protein [Dysgonamonadaceae bacterium]|jgi:phosphopantetheinyl transferase|nr:4'-phosphopantetheinyl transferase superfamily protein [Dysgonamonadaceae bacterium]
MELLAKKFTDNSMTGICPLQYDSKALLSRLEHKEWYLPELEKMHEHRKCEWLSIRLLIKEMLGEEKEIRYQPNGKPYLTDGSHNISISHTKGYVAVILSRGKEVGIDIERISQRVKKVVKRFMNEEEIQHIPLDGEIVYLLLHWSAKESVFKVLNTEIVDFKKQIIISSFKPIYNGWGVFEAKETKTNTSFPVYYFVTGDFVLTLIE